MSGIGIVGFAFALRAMPKPNKQTNPDVYEHYEQRAARDPYYRYAPEPNPCNIRIGWAVSELTKRYDAKAVVVQWEVARCLRASRSRLDREVGLNVGGRYLESRDVWNVAKAEFEAAGITEVIPVAQQFLHLWLVKRMIRKDGFTVIKADFQPIGYDDNPLNVQWWTRSAVLLLIYAFLKPFERFAPTRRQST